MTLADLIAEYSEEPTLSNECMFVAEYAHAKARAEIRAFGAAHKSGDRAAAVTHLECWLCTQDFIDAELAEWAAARERYPNLLAKDHS